MDNFIFPSNYDESGSILLGLLNVRRLLESLVLLPFLLTFLQLPFILPVKLAVILLVFLPLFVFALMGYQGMGIVTFGMQVYHYITSTKAYSFKRIYTKISEIGKRRRNDRRRHRK